MVKSEKLGKLALMVGLTLAVFLFAIFAMSTNANADELEAVDDAAAVEEVVTDDIDTAQLLDAAEPAEVPVETLSEIADVPGELSIDAGQLALRNVEYAGANKINFRLCLHGYELLPDDATVTVTAYLPVTNTVFYRSTFTKDYLAFKDVFNITGGTTHGAILNLPGACVLKIEVNGADIDGWDLIYGNTVEEAIIWHPSSGFTGVAADYVPGNATYFFMSNIGGHLVHLGIDGANPNPPIGDDDDDDDDDDDPNIPPIGDDDDDDDDDPNVPPIGDDDDDDDDDPNVPPISDDDDDDDDPNIPKPGDDDDDDDDKPNQPPKDDNDNKPPKEPAKTGDTRSIALFSSIAVISLAVLTATRRKREDN